ncbi:Phosphoglycerate mutase 2 [Hondaea fermentalgiana]|uniref:Phosphoglycerate mutase 2 n=1 Tax=Hondaea fermentalgiana TaxID=2315210 RepID=A0A2R5GTM4_9STRA|nr:Phosphoglycerate mutase 2 [Hondaea fermentalgiana]|eukprot:GBG31741.1 Phosphoglycerate mutase 2 [Hondaea fermentalgiana]
MAGTRVVVVCVRHGETNFNREKRLQGQLDTELSELGKKQAARTASYLAAQHKATGFDNAVSSDLRRAFETATCIAKACNLGTVNKEPRLRELHAGVLQGVSIADSRRDAAKRQIVEGFKNDADYVIPEGESRRVLYERASAALEQVVLETASRPADAASAPNSRRVLLVAHGGVLNVLYSFVNQLDLNSDHAPHSGNCSIGTISALVTDGAVLSWEISSWGQDHHLHSDATESDVL